MKHLTRKDFLKTTLVGSSAALLGGRLYGQAPAVAASGSANGDIRVAVVGINGQGGGHIRTYYDMPGTRLVALCDADSAVLDKRVAEAKEKNIEVTAYRDYRKLLEDKNIDAVVIATPNHHHSLFTIWALQAGKDVYVEKPLSHNAWEGRQAVEAAKRATNRVAVIGTQNRSSLDIAEAHALVHSGKMGKIQWVRGLCYKRRNSIGKTVGPQPIPASVDYDLWTGPAVLTPPRRNSPQRGPIHYDWHWFFNYGGGDMTNQGIHQMDVARWMLGEHGLPPSVQSFGGRFGYDDDADTPNTLVSVFNYAKAPLIFETRGLPSKAGMQAMDAYRGSRVGVVVQCENGYLTIAETGNVAIFDNDNKRVQTLTNGGNGAHRANFVKALQTRKVVEGVLEEGHYSSALCHLANVSYLLGADKQNTEVAEAIKANESSKEAFARTLEHLKANEVPSNTPMTLGPLLNIDPAKEMFTGRETTIVNAANNNHLRKRAGRAPFTVPDMQARSVAGA